MAYRILFVCSGNTCRSPLAEAVARRVFADEGWDDVVVESAGTFATEGTPASAGSLEVARAHGLDLEGFASRRLTEALVEGADVVLVMEPSHRPAVLGLSPQADLKTHLLGEPAGETGPDAAVADPFGGPAEAYLRTYRQIEQLVRGGVRRLRELAREKNNA